MRERCLLVAMLVLAPCVAAAQNATSDGVQAMVRGDYASAVRILHPLAEATSNPDPLAQFFLAILYQEGRGVAGDHIRACGLYRKSTTVRSPVTTQARVLAEEIDSHSSPFGRQLCSTAAERGWGEPPAATVTLAQDHRVRIDETGLTVNFKGTERRPQVNWGGPGWIFLPIRYTQIDVPRPAEMRRHFIEFVVWIPLADQQTWHLTWFVHEVVGADSFSVPGDGTIAIASGPQPPASFNVDDVARIVVSDDGEVERVILGAHARRTVIPPRSVP